MSHPRVKSAIAQRRAELELREIELRAHLRVARAREELLAFTLYTKPNYLVNWHHRLLCQKLDRFARGELKRLMVFMPPRHGKSELVSRRLPAFLFGRDPDCSVIAISYGSDLAQRMNRDTQKIIDSDLYREVFPNTKLYGKNIRTTAEGSYLRNSDIFEIVDFSGVYRGAGIGGALTGMGADFIIIDDPIKNRKEANSKTYRDMVWSEYNDTIDSRLEKDGGICLTLTRWHEDDLAGRLLKLAAENPNADQWEVLCLPAIRDDLDNPDDPRELGEALWSWKRSLKSLLTAKARSPHTFEALYQQRPTAQAGDIVSRDWWKEYSVEPAGRFDEVIISVDLATDDADEADFCVFQCWGKKGADKYLLDQVRDRMDFPSQLKALKAFAAKHPRAARKIIEKKANGAALIKSAQRDVSGLIPFNPQTSKEDRARAVSPEIQAGNVFLPAPSNAPWISDYIEEWAAFPRGKNDDQVDATTQALIYFQGEISGTFDESLTEIPKGRTIVPSIRTGDQW